MCNSFVKDTCALFMELRDNCGILRDKFAEGYVSLKNKVDTFTEEILTGGAILGRALLQYKNVNYGIRDMQMVARYKNVN